MIGFSSDIIIIFAGIFFLAAFIHGSTGFGFPMVATPLLALVSDIQTAILLTLVPTFLVNLVSINTEGSLKLAIHRHISLMLLVMSGATLGTFVLMSTQSIIFEALLAVAIIFYLLADKIKLNFTWIRNYPQFSKIIFGFSAGLLGGLTNVMAPILIIYSLEMRYTKSDLIQVANLCFLSGKIIQVVLFSTHGALTVNELSTSVFMIVFVALALTVGVNIRKKIRVDTYMKILRFFLLILSISLLIKVAI